MKKKFLLPSILAACAAVASNAQEVVFDFTDPTSLSGLEFKPMTLTELRSAKYINESDTKEKDRCYKSGNNHVLIIDGETISKDGVSFSVSNPDIYKDYPRFFFGLIGKTYPPEPAAENFYCDLRWYKTQVLEINAPEGKKIEKIVMSATSGDNPKRANGNTIVQTEGGKQTISDDKTLNEWVADSESEISTVVYKASADSPTQMAYSLSVTLADAGSGSAITEINAADSAAPVEYYNLTGVRQNGDTLVPGVYVRRQGSKAQKFIVK